MPGWVRSNGNKCVRRYATLQELITEEINVIIDGDKKISILKDDNNGMKISVTSSGNDASAEVSNPAAAVRRPMKKAAQCRTVLAGNGWQPNGNVNFLRCHCEGAPRT